MLLPCKQVQKHAHATIWAKALFQHLDMLSSLKHILQQWPNWDDKKNWRSRKISKARWFALAKTNEKQDFPRNILKPPPKLRRQKISEGKMMTALLAGSLVSLSAQHLAKNAGLTWLHC